MKTRLLLPARVPVVLAMSLTLTPTVCLADAGDLDPAFGIGGKVTTDFASSFDVANSVAIQADGKIVVVGRAANSVSSDAALARYNPDGSLDASFGTNGFVTTNIPTNLFSDSEWFDVAIQTDGRIVTAGLVLTGIATLRDFAVARYNLDGSLDTAFGTTGVVTTPFPFNSDRVSSLAIQADGKIVVAGLLFVTVGRDFALMRYNSDGSLDTGFGTNGVVTTSFPSSSDEEVLGVAIQADGKIVAAGRAVFALADFALARYNPDGSLDTAFGSNGRVTTDFALSADFANDVVIQGDGKILAVGQTFRSGLGFDFALARYDPNGSLDSGFGTNGLVIADLGSGLDIAYAVAIQPDGKLVLAGTFGAGLANDFALARYNPDGSLDGSFGSNGHVTTDFTSSSDIAHGVALQADGKIVAVGVTSVSGGTGPDFALARYEGRGPQEQIDDLMMFVLSINLPPGIENSLIVKLEDAQQELEAGNIAGACDDLGAFINQVQAQAGKKLTTDQANQLVAAASEIRALLGCP